MPVDTYSVSYRHECSERNYVEIWRDVVGYEAEYQVSNLGRVKSKNRSFVRKNGSPMRVSEKIVSGFLRNGYASVTLRSLTGKKEFFVHRLVAAAFIGVRPEGTEVCHGDGVRLNNRVENLRYGTRSDNVKDAIKHGTHYTPWRAKGEEHAASKITADIARSIRESSKTSYQLAKELGVSRALISNVRRGITWSHVN